jgi:hypothetical protein
MSLGPTSPQRLGTASSLSQAPPQALLSKAVLVVAGRAAASAASRAQGRGERRSLEGEVCGRRGRRSDAHFRWTKEAAFGLEDEDGDAKAQDYQTTE